MPAPYCPRVSNDPLQAAIDAHRKGVCTYTLANINQGPGEGNYDRVERLRMSDAVSAYLDAIGLDVRKLRALALELPGVVYEDAVAPIVHALGTRPPTTGTE